MLRVRAKGKRIGKPPVEANLRQQIAERVAEVGAYQASKEFRIDPKTDDKSATEHINLCVSNSSARTWSTEWVI
jgi:hypothetical protein